MAKDSVLKFCIWQFSLTLKDFHLPETQSILLLIQRHSWQFCLPQFRLTILSLRYKTDSIAPNHHQNSSQLWKLKYFPNFKIVAFPPNFIFFYISIKEKRVQKSLLLATETKKIPHSLLVHVIWFLPAVLYSRCKNLGWWYILIEKMCW